LKISGAAGFEAGRGRSGCREGGEGRPPERNSEDGRGAPSGAPVTAPVTLAVAGEAQTTGWARQAASAARGRAALALEQLESGLGALVGLGEHGRTGLDQDVPASELGGFLGDIDIDDAAVGGFEIGLVHRV